VILASYLFRHRALAKTKFLAAVLLLILLLSFGPYLWLDGHKTRILLPWALFMHLPLIGAALPSRFMVYASLVAAVIVALWLAESGPGGRRYIYAVLACVSLLPYPHPTTPVPAAVFFAPGRAEQFLGANARVLILPFGITGPSSFWQQQNRFGFSQSGGYLGYPPGAAQHDPIFMRFYFGLDSPGFLADFVAYCHATLTQYVVAGPGTTDKFLARIKTLDWSEKKIDDVTVFTVPAS
jgi:hypothetical protein